MAQRLLRHLMRDLAANLKDGSMLDRDMFAAAYGRAFWSSQTEESRMNSVEPLEVRETLEALKTRLTEIEWRLGKIELLLKRLTKE
jgi:hypothetical protein